MKEMAKVFISGMMTDDLDNYKERFAACEKKLTERGLIVLNPAMLPGGMRPEDYMKICFALIDVADIVYFMTGWQHSGGAALEQHYCKYIGKNRKYESHEKQI